MNPSDKSKRVLSDHKLVGKKFVPPIKQLKGGLETIRWLDVILPEILWIALLQENLGHERSVEICVALGRINRQINERQPPFGEDISVDLALASSYLMLSKRQYENLKNILEKKGMLQDIVKALSPLIELYPQCPLSGMKNNSFSNFFSKKLTYIKEKILCSVCSGYESEDVKMVKEFKVFLGKYFYRRTHLTNLVEATASCMSDLSGRIQYTNNVKPPNYNTLLDNLPETDEYEKAAAKIRARTLILFMPNRHSDKWPRYFWERGLELDECE